MLNFIFHLSLCLLMIISFFLENIKQELKRLISWNKCRSEITIQTKNNNLHYLIDPTFRKSNRLFVLSFKNGENDHSVKNKQ